MPTPPMQWLGPLVVLVLVAAGPAAGQETRAATIAEAQARKAAALRPEQPGRIERVIVALRKAAVESPSGPHPIVDSIYRGGGATAGVGYRQFVADRTVVDAHAMYSLKHYKMLAAVVTSPGHAGERLQLQARGGWLDAPEVGYYGLGAVNARGDRASFRLQQAWADASAELRPVPLVRLGAGAGIEAFTLGAGRGRWPSIETRYAPEDVPGFGRSPTYAHTFTAAAFDWRPVRGYARRGGSYEVAYHRYDGDGPPAARVDVDLVQHVPLLRETWVFSGHTNVQSTVGDGVVPYFLLPALGGGTTLRAYQSWRFRDRHALLFQGEFRWNPNLLGLEMALFYDAGTVAPTRGRLTRSPFTADVGVGMRIHSFTRVPARIELAKGEDGFKLVLGAKAAF